MVCQRTIIEIQIYDTDINNTYQKLYHFKLEINDKNTHSLYISAAQNKCFINYGLYRGYIVIMQKDKWRKRGGYGAKTATITNQEQQKQLEEYS